MKKQDDAHGNECDKIPTMRCFACPFNRDGTCELSNVPEERQKQIDRFLRPYKEKLMNSNTHMIDWRCRKL